MKCNKKSKEKLKNENVVNIKIVTRKSNLQREIHLKQKQ